MGWKFECVDDLLQRVKSFQKSDAARDAFNAGLMSSSVFAKVNRFSVVSRERAQYDYQLRCDEVITTLPDIVSCGVDLPLVGEMGDAVPRYYVPFEKGVSIKVCLSDCGKLDFEAFWLRKEKQAGAAFGALLDVVYWRGLPVLGYVGITELEGTEHYNLVGNPKYGDLLAADANTIANFFFQQSYGMDDPVICIGAVTLEAIGWQSMSSSGDSCSDLWDCVVSRLASRWGISVDEARGRFVVNAVYDNVVGIDPDNPADVHAVVHAMDREQVLIGLEDEESGRGCARALGRDLVFADRLMHITAPQNRMEGANRFAFGFVDHQNIVDCTGDRYGDCPAPVIELPAALVAPAQPKSVKAKKKAA